MFIFLCLLSGICNPALRSPEFVIPDFTQIIFQLQLPTEVFRFDGFKLLSGICNPAPASPEFVIPFYTKTNFQLQLPSPVCRLPAYFIHSNPV